MTQIAVVPAFRTRDEFADILPRLLWCLGPHAQFIDSIHLFGEGLDPAVALADHFDPAILDGEGARSLAGKLVIAPAPADAAGRNRLLAEAALVLAWRDPADDAFGPLAALRERVDGERLRVVDPRETQGECSLLLGAGLALRPDIAEVEAENFARYLAFAERVGGGSALVCGTGPSLDSALAFEPRADRVICCNSIVRNRALLAALDPVAVCAADPIFHAGPSSYAGRFRAAVLEAMGRHGFTLVVPMRDYFVWRSVLPPAFHERLIAVPFRRRGTFHFALRDEFGVEPYANILTLLMLPLAGDLFDSIAVAGCDGRPAGPADYFWTHHAPSQFSEEMAAIRRAHPGFFKISYDDYYTRHCNDVELALTRLEAAEKSVRGLTASYIPALRRRGAPEPARQAEPGGPLRLVSIAPDISGRVGHYWNYEINLAAALKSEVAGYAVITNRSADADFSGTAVDSCLERLSSNSWTIGNRPTVTAEEQALTEHVFEVELRAALDEILAAAPGPLVLYMYIGSLEHARVVFRVANENPLLHANVNLFYLTTEEVWRGDFLDKWMGVLKEARDNPRLVLTVMTDHQRQMVLLRSGINLDVARHPSPLMPDARARAALAQPPARAAAGAPKRVLFPASDRQEKGSLVAFDIARAVAERYGGPIEFHFRTLGAGVSAADLRQATLHELPRELDNDHFLAVLAESDVVVLPYATPSFADRTSGLIVDALLCGAPAVVARGTWLARIVQTYRSGLVADTLTPEHFAEAVVDLLTVPISAAMMRHAGTSYLADHSWALLAADILKEPRRLLAEAPPPAGTGLALFGPLPAAAAAAFDADALIAAAMAETGAAGAVVWFGAPVGRAQAPAGGPLILADISTQRLAASLAKLRRDQPEAAATARMVSLNSDRSPEQVALRAERVLVPEIGRQAAGQVLLLRSDDSANARAAARMAAVLKPQIAVIVFDIAGATGGTGYDDAARALAEAGLRVFVVEMHEEFAPFAPRHVRRVGVFPMGGGPQRCPGWLIGLRPSVPVSRAKELFWRATTNAANVAAGSLGDGGESIRIWRNAAPMRPEAVIAAAPTAFEGLQLSGLAARSQPGPDRFVSLSETEEERLHRAALDGAIVAGAPVTLSVDVRPGDFSFLALWLTDVNSKVLAEAVFDLDMARVASTHADWTGSTVLAGAAFDEPRQPEAPLRLWLTVLNPPCSMILRGQIATLLTPTGQRSRLGQPAKSFALRDMLMERAPGPSRFDPALLEASADAAAPEEQTFPVAAMAASDLVQFAPAGETAFVLKRNGAPYGRHLTMPASLVFGASYRLTLAVEELVGSLDVSVAGTTQTIGTAGRHVVAFRALSNVADIVLSLGNHRFAVARIGRVTLGG